MITQLCIGNLENIFHVVHMSFAKVLPIIVPLTKGVGVHCVYIFSSHYVISIAETAFASNSHRTFRCMVNCVCFICVLQCFPSSCECFVNSLVIVVYYFSSYTGRYSFFLARFASCSCSYFILFSGPSNIYNGHGICVYML